ncbi:hypothetical protein MGYG_07847 [Nannizzia gypsea CBS 118893]|uniref:F-box domain-containing protein n=1 Tax=Arthroderma gypseum (strain ATCC MYA-4604 / CBS 118893) TaxID=535722 RepID=E4V4B9_ARTGP|nr:hypothetical protein MGYG_07847 [Nannizzia gypsea CBS 118893]EFR04843.1 hypothetical protein MGYG_07847 [Nannizzia gypsea CBS 118893]
MATLETVPEEIFLSIFDCLDHSYKPDYLRYLTVSRRWQRAVERFFFEDLSIDSAQLSNFAALFQGKGAHRKALVKQLSYHAVLPPYDGDDCHQHEELNNQVFSAAILELFQILETFSEDEAVKANFGRGRGIVLYLEPPVSPNDKNIPPPDKEYRLHAVFIRLLNPKQLPTLACVSDLIVGCIGGRRILDPASGVYLASMMKNLNCWRMSYNDYWESITDETLIRIRRDFIKALSNHNQAVAKFDLRSQSCDRIDESIPAPKHTSSPTAMDPFSIAIHEFIQRANVSVIDIEGTHPMSPEILWPYKTVKDVPVPLWPKLEHIFLYPAHHTPDGDWYFSGDPKIASHSEFSGPANGNGVKNLVRLAGQTENTFRSVLVPERIDPFLKAIAQVVRHVPSLRRLDVWFGDEQLCPRYVKVDDLRRRFRIFYFAPGMKSWYDEESPRSRPRIICDVGGSWRASEEIEEMWMEAMGPNGLIHYHH